jgi:Fur family zinc uptake transcriptional regulator
MPKPDRTSTPRSPSAFAASGHDHGACVADALLRAQALCEGRGARLTELRRRVLELVWSSHEPVGAYRLLEQLDRDAGGQARRAAPPTVYRALDFLIEQGLVHRIESLNAFVGCDQPLARHAGQFLICARCGVAVELNDPGVAHALATCADRLGFQVERPTVEVKGICPNCVAGGAAAHPSLR